ncbi:hypothetical protein MKK69_00485 [Methylobacterium sp. J-026]|uniref:hypothetical protein n=1 Tax=Methylobacterium sp. J-026 TaxID=2836624 RepID=UPI001FB8853E|nr:hypothetical protein [Methylobacterium sp. J-026]MCJ2132560.1 hypothetical protein [Methylobacterium sp. J-026]
MTHARIPDFSPRPTAVVVSIRPQIADPVLAAIEAHAEAWAVYQTAKAGRPLEIAEIGLAAALDDLLATPCRSHTGALALVRHLRWLIREVAITAGAESYLDRFVLTREADLSRFAGSDLLPDMLPADAPTERLAQPVELYAQACQAEAPREAVRRRLMHPASFAGEVLAAAVIIGGGAVLTGLATLL